MKFYLWYFCLPENIPDNASNSYMQVATKVTSISKPDYKILFAQAFPEKYQPQSEQVDAYGYLRMLADLSPCLLHAVRPVDVVKNKYGILVAHRQALVEIFECSFICMVSVEEGEPDILMSSGHSWQ